jgi:molybdopterin synthase catalytic subunit
MTTEAADRVALVREPIDLASLHSVADRDGALCVFVGTVRDLNRGRAVLALEYEAYEEMALALMREIVAETKSRFPVTAVRLVHRLGRLVVGDPSVAVSVSSPHRAEAFAACRFAIDTLKARVPIWKKEFYADGSEWLDRPPAP